MARLARFVFPGLPHHVAQEGSGGRRVFEEESDYRLYLEWLGEYTDRYGVDIWAYCLMPRRVDFICVPRQASSLALAFNSLRMRFALFVNGRTGSHGPLWKPRFQSCVLDDPSAREDVRSVETIPVRAGVVARPEDHAWSSARARLFAEKGLIPISCRLDQENGDWKAFLSEPLDEALIARVRERLKTGRPAGEADFVRNLEESSGRRLRAMPRGRPRKRHVNP
jgi:putative transposase